MVAKRVRRRKPITVNPFEILSTESSPGRFDALAGAIIVPAPGPGQFFAESARPIIAALLEAGARPPLIVADAKTSLGAKRRRERK